MDNQEGTMEYGTGKEEMEEQNQEDLQKKYDDTLVGLVKANASIMKLESDNKMYKEYYQNYWNIRDGVFSFFDNAFDGAGDSIRVTRDEANELLEELGCETLSTKWLVTLSYDMSFAVNAKNKEDAIDQAKDSLDIRSIGDANLIDTDCTDEQAEED